MKFAATAVALTLAVLTLAPATAQTAQPTPAAPAANTKYTLDTPIVELAADAKAKAVLTTDLGTDVTQHPMYDSFKAMSLNQVAPMSGGAITDEMLKKTAADLAAIK